MIAGARGRINPKDLLCAAPRFPVAGGTGTDREAEPIADVDVARHGPSLLEAFSARTEQAEEEFARFFAQSRDLLCIAGLDGYFKRLNRAWTARLGWTLEELLARPFLELVHAEDRAATLEELDALAQGEETTLFENRYRHRDGTYRWLRWSARPVPGQQTIYATARDVTRQKRLEKEILEILDRERERLGRELHDGLCQNLAGIAALSASLSKRLLASSEPATAAAAAEIGELLKGTIEQARNLARGLGPMGLDELGLEGVLEALAVNVRHLFGVSCSLECDGSVDGLGREAESHLFRIVQEAVNNGISHGKADHIEIELSANGGEGRLCVADDGVGLADPKDNPEGIGMHTMAYRARLIGGSLEVRRRDTGGTRVTCVFSLPERS